MSTNAELHQRRLAAIPRGVANSLPVYADRATTLSCGTSRASATSTSPAASAVLNTGHRHPSVIKAISAQLERLMHTCFQVTPYASYIELCEQLNKLAPGPTAKKSMLFSTGAEAMENALKVARYHTKRSGVIAFSGRFHGRTLAAMTLTGKVQPYKAGFGPMMPGYSTRPFP